ncbi:ABC transporter permease [Ancylobacter defluvii]|uniref:ABC transporter permease n=1 Tax=Ancylobacter defluvii TaxID=1282440 RepID=UPI001BCC4445|nr:ABC transporter permease [Ancylobacter defluvii]MBS7588496.1 ABC transporter permease [Ancylobacter defluvii]
MSDARSTQTLPSASPVTSSARATRLRFAAFWGLPPLVWQLAFFVVPLGFLVAMTFWSVKSFRLTPDATLANWTFILNAGFFRNAYVYTFWLAGLTALLASLIAFPAAYTLAFRLQPATRRFLVFMLVVPFFTSYPVRIYSTQIFFSPQGIINAALHPLGLGPISVLNSPTGTVIGYLVLTLPLVVLLQTFALMNVPKTLIEAAHNLGCGRLRTILTVIVPSARIGLVVAATFAFVLAFGDYVAPLYLGGSKPPTLSILIADQVKSGNHWPRASVVAVIMILTLVAVMSTMLALAYGRRGAKP